jgi:hypothetical protein
MVFCIRVSPIDPFEPKSVHCSSFCGQCARRTVPRGAAWSNFRKSVLASRAVARSARVQRPAVPCCGAGVIMLAMGRIRAVQLCGVPELPQLVGYQPSRRVRSGWR